MATAAPVLVTLYVRHSADCKYQGDEFERRCRCRKHFRWNQNGTRFRRKAGTRSWAEAETLKRDLEDQFSGRSEPKADSATRSLEECITVFIKDKTVQGVSKGVISKYTRELERLRDYCEREGVFTVRGVTRELLTGYCATWEAVYPSTQTRSMVRARCRSFLRYCYEAQWLARIPALPKIKVEEPPTLPLSADEYAALLKGVKLCFKEPERRARVQAFIQLMRWSGLSVQDSLTLEQASLKHDEAKGVYRVVTNRQKTGTHVSVPIPPAIAKEVLAVAASNSNPLYIFWDGKSDIVKSWTKYFIAPVFKAAKIERGGNMMSHRLRDTFAVDLLEKGVPLEEVSKLLGHESIKTTEKHYAKWVKGRQDRLDELVTGTWTKKGHK